MRHKITIYIDQIYHNHEVIDDCQEIAKVVKMYLSHLGYFDMTYQPKPKTFFQKIIRSIQGH